MGPKVTNYLGTESLVQCVCMCADVLSESCAIWGGKGRGVGVKFQVLSISTVFRFIMEQMAFRMTKGPLKLKPPSSKASIAVYQFTVHG